MMKQEKFSLHLPEEASVSDAYIFLVERLQPLKSEALAYLDDAAAMPRREARVILHRFQIYYYITCNILYIIT